jgi:alpha-glucosidase
MADGGYDVADYRQIDPQFGSLSDAESLIAEAHALDIRVVLDIVPNHCSDRHPWFVSALSSAPGSAERRRFYFRPRRGPRGELPPNDWQSEFGGSAWTRTTGPDGLLAEWYLHLFAPEQPDFNWEDPAVRAEFEAVLRFWFDRGVDGFRVDSAALVAKDPGLSDIGARPGSYAPGQHPFVDRDEVHAIYRSWRRIADSYPDKRALIGEVWLADRERFALYLRDDEFHSAFNFDFLTAYSAIHAATMSSYL